MGCTLRAMRRDLAEALPLYGEMHRFVPVLAQQYGARLAQVPVRIIRRTAGKTKYNLTRTFRVILDLITIKFLHSYLTRPMHVMGLAGLLSMGLGVVSLLVTVWMKAHSRTVHDRQSVVALSALLELVGVQFISLGLLGEVMTRTYFESQGKTAYTVRSTLDLEVPKKAPSSVKRGARQSAEFRAPSPLWISLRGTSRSLLPGTKSGASKRCERNRRPR